MKTRLKSDLSLLTLALTLAGCSTMPFFPPAAEKAPTTKKAPVTDRSARRPQTAQPAAAPQVEVGQLPQEDPLLPREYAPGYPAASDPYAAPTRPYPPNPNSAARPPAYPPVGNANQPVSGNSYRPPAYPPGAAAPYPPASQPYPASPEGYGRTAPSPAYPAYPQGADPNYGAAPSSEGYGRTAPASSAYPAYPQSTDPGYGAPPPGSLPEPQPVTPKTPRTAPPASRPAPDNTAVASAPAPAPVEPTAPPPPPAPRQPAPTAAPPADLPPAEITREGNQAVAALLESADKHVKSNQLDKAGAALERALRIEPRNAGIWHDLAQIRLHQGQYAQAESLASKSANLAGSNRALQARNWKVIASARKAAGNASGAEEAEARAAQLAR